MNPEELRMAGDKLGAFLTQFGIDTAKTAGRVGAEALGTAIGKNIGSLIPTPQTGPVLSSLDKAQAYKMQTMMLAHQQQLQQLAIEEQMQKQKYFQQIGTIQARHQYDQPSMPAQQAYPGMGIGNMSNPSVNMNQVYLNALNAPRAQNRIF
jgi:hypothetical protein